MSRRKWSRVVDSVSDLLEPEAWALLGIGIAGAGFVLIVVSILAFMA